MNINNTQLDWICIFDFYLKILCCRLLRSIYFLSSSSSSQTFTFTKVALQKKVRVSYFGPIELSVPLFSKHRSERFWLSVVSCLFPKRERVSDQMAGISTKIYSPLSNSACWMSLLYSVINSLFYILWKHISLCSWKCQSFEWRLFSISAELKPRTFRVGQNLNFSHY